MLSLEVSRAGLSLAAVQAPPAVSLDALQTALAAAAVEILSETSISTENKVATDMNDINNHVRQVGKDCAFATKLTIRC